MGKDSGQAKIGALVLFALLLLATFVLATYYSSSEGEKRLDQRLNVEQLGKVHPSLRTVADTETVKVILKVREGEDLSAHVTRGRIRQSADSGLLFAELDGEELAALAADSDALEVWPDLETMAHLDRSAYQAGADALWALNLTGENVTVAILDTGVAASHEMLAGRVVESADFTGTSPADGHGHGTHVAGIAAGDGQYRGIAPGARILSGKVLNDDGYGQLSWLIEGIDWAVANGADIISLSLGATYDGSAEEQLGSPEVQKIEEAVAAGVVVVVASGNCGNGCGDFTGVTTPGIARNALTVGAVDREDNHLAFSGGAAIDDYIKPDVVAPGQNICSSVPWGYECWSGTSMAAPHVSGAAALLLQHNPSLAPSEVRSLLEQGALDLGTPGKDTQYGAGALNLSGALGLNAEETPSRPLEYRLDIPVLVAGEEGAVTLAFTNLYGEECTGRIRLLCKPRRITVEMTVEELDSGFSLNQTKAIPLNTSRDYVLEFAPLVPGRHRLTARISEGRREGEGGGSDTLYTIATSFDVGAPDAAVTMNPVRLVMR